MKLPEMRSHIFAIVSSDSILDGVDAVSLNTNTVYNQLPAASVIRHTVNQKISVRSLSNALVHINLVKQRTRGFASLMCRVILDEVDIAIVGNVADFLGAKVRSLGFYNILTIVEMQIVANAGSLRRIVVAVIQSRRNPNLSPQICIFGAFVVGTVTIFAMLF